MFFSFDDYSATQGSDSIIQLLPPVIETNGREKRFREIKDGSSCGKYAEGELFASDTVSCEGGGIFLIKRRFENKGRYRRVCKLITEAYDLFAAAKSTIPCVSFDGNRLSKGAEPHGWSLNGETWIFGSDRVSIPAATVTEDKTKVAALFASPKGPVNQNCACAFIELPDGRMSHRIYYPVTEAPLSYTGHDEMSPRYDTYLTMECDSVFEIEFYIFCGKPIYENYGNASLFRRTAELIPFTHELEMTEEQIYDCALAWGKHTLCEEDGHWMFRNCMLPDPKNPSGFYYPWKVYEGGWSGQCVQFARIFVEATVKHGREKDYAEKGISCLDAWVAAQRPRGLFPRCYKSKNNIDVCNHSWVSTELLRTYEAAKGTPYERDSYLQAGLKGCDFLYENYTDEDAFGFLYSFETEEKLQGGGSIGGFAVMAMMEAFKVTGDKKYLDISEKALDFYFERDLNNFVCTAGAIDCQCVDKETSYPFVMTSLDVYEATGNAKYLEYAKKAGYYFASYMFMYDVICPESSDFNKYGYFTSGGTAVSTQHPPIDPWGEIVVPEYIRLYMITGDGFWKDIARRMWINACLCITKDDNTVIHGRKRIYGSQNEAYFPNRWARPLYYRNVENKGTINDLYANWTTTYRVTAMDRTADLCEGKRISDII